MTHLIRKYRQKIFVCSTTMTKGKRSRWQTRSVKLIIMPQQTLNCSPSVSASNVTHGKNKHSLFVAEPPRISQSWLEIVYAHGMCVSSYAWSPRLAQQPGSEWSKYELVLWILVNYHGLFAWDNDRPGLAKTASLYVRRKWALPQTLSVNRRKHRNTDAEAAVMRSVIISQSNIRSKAEAGQTSNDG